MLKETQWLLVLMVLISNFKSDECLATLNEPIVIIHETKGKNFVSKTIKMNTLAPKPVTVTAPLRKLQRQKETLQKLLDSKHDEYFFYKKRLDPKSPKDKQTILRETNISLTACQKITKTNLISWAQKISSKNLVVLYSASQVHFWEQKEQIIAVPDEKTCQQWRSKELENQVERNQLATQWNKPIVQNKLRPSLTVLQIIFGPETNVSCKKMTSAEFTHWTQQEGSSGEVNEEGLFEGFVGNHSTRTFADMAACQKFLNTMTSFTQKP